jgi:hypothetical protein
MTSWLSLNSDSGLGSAATKGSKEMGRLSVF